IIQWDVKSWSKALSYWDSKVEWNKIQHSLELGGREGGLSLWLALKGKSVVCSDLKDVQKTAEQLHKRHQVSTWITYQDIDATNIPYEEYFDLIVFKSIIGGIGRNDNYKNQHKVFKEIYKALKPGGKLLFAENLAASAVHRRLRKRFVQWGSSWRYVSLDEMKEFLSDFSYYDSKATGLLGTFGRTERQRNVLSAVDDLVLNKICPDRWKYICYGIAEK
ncbi:MAG: SAM-dependent methyltransferase, partial [Bacteroidota bacterium]